MEELEESKNPDTQNPAGVPEDILKKTRRVGLGVDMSGKNVHRFFDKQEGGKLLYEIPYSSENKRAYQTERFTAQEDEAETETEAAPAVEIAPEPAPAAESPKSTVAAEAEVESSDEPKTHEPPQAIPTMSIKRSQLRPAVEQPRDRDEDGAERQPQQFRDSRAEKQAEPIYVEPKPESTRMSNVRSPFSAPRQEPHVQGVGPDSYLPRFIRERLPQSLPPHPALQEEPPTMDVILSDPKKQELFGTLVETLGGDTGKTIIGKLMSIDRNPDNLLTEAERSQLRQYRVEFQRRTLLLEEVREATTPEDVSYMLQNDPNFDSLRQFLKPERVADVIKLHVEKTFFRVPAPTVDRIVFAQRATRDMRRSEYFQKMRTQIQERLSKSNFTFGNAAAWTPEGRQTALEFLKPTFLEQWNGMSAESSAEVLESIDLNRTNIMKVLGATISSDTEQKLQIIREAQTGVLSVVATGETGPTTIGEAWQEQLEGEIQIENTDALRARIRQTEFREAVEKRVGKSWADMGERDREAASYEQLQDEGKLPQRKRGWFGMWLGSIFDTLFPNMQRELANEFE